jgi:two-component system sensor histidine kinase DegS
MKESLDVQSELDETQRALREITMLIEQSQGELGKLTQRNAAITAHLQQVQKQAQVSPDELKMAYDSALDAQQRLFVMRGQLDKLQSDRQHLDKYKTLLELSGSSIVQTDTSDGDHIVKGPSAEVENIVNAQEAERQRLSRQMHDGPAQALSNFILQTEIAMRLLDADPSQVRNELTSLKSAAMNTFQKVRNYIFELRPMMLDDLGLIPTIRKYVDAFKEQSGGIEVELTITGNERRLDSYLEVMIFRAIQELLGNSARHSQSSSIKLNIDLSSDIARITVEDNGRGFDPDTLADAKNLGLKLIRERTEMLGGKFEVDSKLGKGARITFVVPLGGK